MITKCLFTFETGTVSAWVGQPAGWWESWEYREPRKVGCLFLVTREKGSGWPHLSLWQSLSHCKDSHGSSLPSYHHGEPGTHHVSDSVWKDWIWHEVLKGVGAQCGWAWNMIIPGPSVHKNLSLLLGTRYLSLTFHLLEETGKLPLISSASLANYEHLFSHL